MLGRSHAMLGAAATGALLITSGTNLIEQPLLFLTSWSVGTLAALLPDIDSPNAMIRLTFGVGREQSWQQLRNWQRKNIFEIAFDALRWFVARLLDILDLFLPHRGPTHWGVTWLGLSLGVYGLCYLFDWPYQIAFSFAIGYFSHLLADGVTKSGVRLFAPFRPKSVRFLPKRMTIRTGSWGEALMLSLMLTAILVYFLLFIYYFAA